MQKLPLLALLILCGCGGLPGPSVPMQQGQTLELANAAIRSCAQFAPRGGQNAIVGGYVTGVLLGGIIVGPIVVASNAENIRAQGEASAVDRCLGDSGFIRRDLTPAELSALNSSGPEQRRRLLDHLVSGGTLEVFAAT
jgi:hypothetical protein